MLAVGLTGGIGAGKSAVADLLVARGAVLIDADRIAREVVEPGTATHTKLVERFGSEILSADGTLDRAAVARVVFNDEHALADLNAITHPAIGAEMLARRQQHEHEDVVVVLAIPLLTAQHRETVGLDAVVVVDCPTDVALERLVTVRGMDRDDAEARLRAQISRQERQQGADFVVDNSGDHRQLRAEVERLWSWLDRRRAQAEPLKR